jgi:peptidoglycan/xylan/chitin deacetylase (PgdA/CDA1 family)
MHLTLSFDVEPDLHTKKYKGILEGIPTLLKLLDRHKIKATFFITCDCLKKHPKIFRNLQKQGHEIALHGYIHKRFDEMSDREKEKQLKDSIACFKKYLKKAPRGFRAPQFSVDKKTLDLLEKYGFKYDSSIAASDISQLFFHKRFGHWIRQFFSPVRKYKIRKRLYEIPPTSIFIPFTSLTLRVFPSFLTKPHYLFLKIFYSDIVFYAHSWDFITLRQSKVMKSFPKREFIRKFRKFLKYVSKKHKKDKFTTMLDLVKK